MTAPRTYLYCYANGVAKFGHRVPDGAIGIDHRTAAQLAAEAKKIKKEKALFRKDPCNNRYPSLPWKASMSARLRHGYDGKTLLVPGIPEARDQGEAYEALKRFKEWAVKGVKK